MEICVTEEKPKVLIIDDEKSFCDLVRELLALEGYEVLIAHSAEEAEPIIDKTELSAILLDIVMPGESGVAFLERLKKADGLPPIIMVTGHPNMNTAVRSIKSGAVDYLSKPVTPEKLIDTVKKAVGLSTMRRSERTVMLNDGAKFIAGYRVKRVLGVGTMGVVYLVEKPGQREGPDEYALKVLKRLAAQSEKELEYIKERFILEARATHGISHPNVIRVYDFGTTEKDLPYILLEFCPGKTMEELIIDDLLTLPEKCRILMQIALALEAIHNKGVCHRDIKPSNVIVRENLMAKLTDFGIARLHDSNLTMTSEVFGSPAFLSPEGFESAKVDHRADIFSFGSMAYQLFTGRLPFEGEDIAVISHKVRKEPPVWPRHMDDSFPAPLEMILRKMMAKDPSKRYQKAHDVYMALGSYMKGKSVSTGTQRIPDGCSQSDTDD
jgi:serine/threonine protein kinase